MKVFIKTYGCPLNEFDSLVIEHYLNENGYQITNSIEDADVLILNTCGVKKQSEDKIIDFVKRLNKRFPYKKLIITGCLPLINFERVTKELKFSAVTGPSVGRRILEVFEAIENNDNLVMHLDNGFYGRQCPIDLKVSLGNIISFPVGVSSGCLDKCSFCGTRHARGSVKSLPIDVVVKLINNVLKRGVREFLLTSSDVGAYGFDLNPKVSIIDLLRAINSLEGSFIVRIGMMNPRWAYKWIDELIELFRSSEKFYYFLHIPVQCGSNRLLKIMRRGHGVEEYIEVVKRLRKEVDDKFSIETDVIVGHPGESDKDFEETLSILKESEPDYVNISKFFPRPNTPSKYMKQIPSQVVKQRSRTVSFLVDSIMFKRNALWMGWRGTIFINEEGKNRTFVGRNYAYKIFVVKGDNLLGKTVWIEALEPHTTWISARYIKETEGFSLFNSKLAA
ncbi:MAG: tRNA (N(6)-L-threonylcarbamoyladenosine(37)-C(2))-methylthiotransferase [Candidatus Geothermarchaeota archaeon]